MLQEYIFGNSQSSPDVSLASTVRKFEGMIFSSIKVDICDLYLAFHLVFLQLVKFFLVYSGRSADRDQVWFFEERLNPNQFFKYTLNHCFKVPRGKEFDYDHQLMQAFSHWSLINEGGKRMVADLQGEGMILTNPLFIDDTL